ncbi:MAG: hypothetical protein HY329_04445 [Chloroflexi bacterium]|nr:hypothetical protein [Chloroflexota bacterium]
MLEGKFDIGWLYVGGRYEIHREREKMVGQAYVEYIRPVPTRRRYPVVFMGGGLQTGAPFLATADGRPGWGQQFVQDGYAVYMVDRPGMGRAGHTIGHVMSRATHTQFSVENWTRAAEHAHWRHAKLHTQWPGEGRPGDPIFDQYFAAQVPDTFERERAEELATNAIVELIDKIGPIVIVNHSFSSAFGWQIADKRPGHVVAIIAVEPSGPPFGNNMPWGLTWTALQFDPPVTDPNQLRGAVEPGAKGHHRECIRLAAGYRLPNLADHGLKVAVVASEASSHHEYEDCTVAFLRDAGVDAEPLYLWEHGILGNNHMMFFEKNSEAIGQLFLDWLDRRLPD